MKKRLYQFCFILLGILLSCPLTIKAVSVEPGGTFTASAICGNIEGSVQIYTDNATLVSGDNWCDRGKTLHATAKATSAGTASVTFVTVDAVYVDSLEDASGITLGRISASVVNPTPSNNGGNTGNSGNSSQYPDNYTKPDEPVNPQPQVKKSSETGLSELNLSKGVLNPKFDTEISNYTVVLEKDVTSISINAKAKDSKASIEGNGKVALKPGENIIYVVVTAEDGTTRTYEIKASVDETPDVFVQYNNQKLGVVKNLSNVTIPESFEKVTVNVSGKDVDAYKSNLRNLTIIYMIDDAEEKNWYLYDENTKTITSVYKPFAILGRNLAIIDIPQELQNRAGMKYQEVEIETVKLMGWAFENPEFENYILVYLMDEQGEMKYYLYEKTEDSIMLYSNQAAVTQKDYDKLSDDFNLRMIMILALAATNVLTIILLIIVMLTKKKKSKKHKKKKHKENKELMEETPVTEEIEEVIEPFDSWKYESMPEQNDPYDDSYM